MAKKVKLGKVKPEVKFEKVDLKAFEKDGLTILTALQQHQVINIDQDHTGEQGEYILGNFDLVNWKDLNITGGAIKTALVETGLAKMELMKSITLLYRTKDKSWNPVLMVLGENKEGFEYDKSQIDEVIEATVVGVGMNGCDQTKDCSTEILDNKTQKTVERVIKETLTAIGGKKIAAPIAVMLDQRHAMIQGKLAPKPSLADLEPKIVDLEGHITGFETSPPEIRISSDDKKVCVNYKPEDLDILKLAPIIKTRQKVTLKVDKTVSIRGIPVFQYREINDLDLKP